MALMAFSDSEVYNDKTCSKTCLKNFETLKKQCDDLIVKLNQTEFTATTYKRGLATLEEQLITYKKNEILFNEEVAVLKREVACKDYEINVLKRSQITDKGKKGLGYSAVPPPHPLIYNRPNKLDLSYSGLDEFKEPEFKGYGIENISKDTSSFVESLLNVDKEVVFPVDKMVESVKPKNHEKPVKKSVRPKVVKTARPNSVVVNAVRVNQANDGKPQQDDIGFVDSGCSRYMTRNIAYLLDIKEFDGGYVAFGGGSHGGRITGKGTLKTDKSLILKMLPDESQILLKIPRKDNMYSFDMKNIIPKETLTCLVAKATSDESMLWHRMLGHINFKNINKLVKDNLKDASYFDSPSKDDNGEPKSIADDQKKNFYNSNFNRFGYLWIYPKWKEAIGTKWVFQKTRKDQRGIISLQKVLKAVKVSVLGLKHQLVLPVQVPAAEGDYINTLIQGNGYSRKGTKRKPKANKSKHGVERAKSKVKPSEENTT
ncbi:putative ribonuclease H-like domain-containing protein [Tanacetum coccineum]